VRDLVLEHIIVKRVIPRWTEITNYHGVDGDYDFSTITSISTDLRPNDIADSIGDRLNCVYWLYSNRVCSCGHW